MGEVFAGRYELLEPVAEGAMGSVWLVRDRQEGDVKAAKLLRQQDAASLLRFIREQGTRIHHRHVVTPLGWAGADDQVLFTMPLLRGGSVATLVSDFGALPETWVAELLGQALSGLAAVHEAGVVHRDIKPANLLLEHTGAGVPHVRVSDFGVAVPSDQPRLTAPMTTFGTPGYMAPEQEQGADPDPRQDLYAVGVTGLQLLAGATSPSDAATSAYALPETELVRVLRTAVADDPADRPQTADEFAALVSAAVATRPWHPGEVEVLEHASVPGDLSVPGEPGVRGEPGVPRTRPQTLKRATTGQVADSSVESTSWWPVAALVVLGLALVVGGVWLLA